MCLCLLTYTQEGPAVRKLFSMCVPNGGPFWPIKLPCEESISVSLQIVQRSFCIIGEGTVLETIV